MGGKREDFKKLTNVRDRMVTFKKRRIGLIKKAIQLSELTGAIM